MPPKKRRKKLEVLLEMMFERCERVRLGDKE
jgi:hypothetical protein